ncbi:hypothetical protein JW921_05740 [Candidatus Fermentibacterales bacterium]|nr:hypothetical protein [Candidatus Fermentibacterales bacterium]
MICALVSRILASLALAGQLDPSGGALIEEYRIDARLDADTMRVRTRVLARAEGPLGAALLRRAGDRYDPEVQSLSLLLARMGPLGGGGEVECWSDIPEWAVDTLYDASSGRAELVFVFPGLTTGWAVEYEVELLDWSGLWECGPWLRFSPGELPGISSLELEIRDDDGGRRISFETDLPGDYTEAPGSRAGEGHLVLHASHPDSGLRVSAIASWEELSGLVLASACSLAGSPSPPDLREAELEIAARSAIGADLARRASFALTDNLRLIASPPLHRSFSCRSAQEILDSRIASSLEMCALLSKMLVDLGLPAALIACSECEPSIPLPDQWTRFAVRLETASGELYLEPAAWASPAGYLRRPEGLWVLEPGGACPPYLAPNTPSENACLEEYELDPTAGRIEMRVQPRGHYSEVLRRLLTAGGSSAPDDIGRALVRWLWRSRWLCMPDTLGSSPLLDLAEPAWLEAVFRVGVVPEGEQGMLLLPALDWGSGEGVPRSFRRRWTIEWQGRLAIETGSGCAAVREGPAWVIEDTVPGRSGGLLIRLESQP